MWASREHSLLLSLLSLFSLALSGGSSLRQPSREVYIFISLSVYHIPARGYFHFYSLLLLSSGGGGFINTFAWRYTWDRVGQICSRVSLFVRIKDYVHLAYLHNADSDCLNARGSSFFLFSKKTEPWINRSAPQKILFIFKVLTSAIYVQGQQTPCVKASKRNKKGTLSLICGVCSCHNLEKSS